jgi:hypothetical protein
MPAVDLVERKAPGSTVGHADTAVTCCEGQPLGAIRKVVPRTGEPGPVATTYSEPFGSLNTVPAVTRAAVGAHRQRRASRGPE